METESALTIVPVYNICLHFKRQSDRVTEPNPNWSTVWLSDYTKTIDHEGPCLQQRDAQPKTRAQPRVYGSSL